MAAKKKAAAKPAKAKAAKKTTARTAKAAPKKAAPKKATAVKAAPAKAAPKPKKLTTVDQPMSKAQLVNHIAGQTELTRKQVTAVFDELSNVIEAHLRKRAAGTFTLPGLLKVTTKHKPAQKARKGINPFTGEPTTFKAKPASVQVKIRPLKKMKDMAK